MTVKQLGLGLGRGLDDLLGKLSNDSITQAERTGDQIILLPLQQLQAGKYQPRQYFDDTTLAELAESIRKQGVIQPIIVRKLDKGGYEIIAGERRFRAAQLAGLQEIPTIIRNISDDDASLVALIENIQREDLNSMHEAEAFLRLQTEFNLTHQQIAEAVGKSRTAVSNTLRLTHLHPTVRDMLKAGQLEMGHARALLALPLAEQAQAGQHVIDKKLSVRATEVLVKRLLSSSKSERGGEIVLNQERELKQLEVVLMQKFKQLVSVKSSSDGGVKVVFEFTTLQLAQALLAD